MKTIEEITLSKSQSSVLNAMKRGVKLVGDYSGESPVWRLGRDKANRETIKVLYCRGMVAWKSASCGYVLYKLTDRGMDYLKSQRRRGS